MRRVLVVALVPFSLAGCVFPDVTKDVSPQPGEQAHDFVGRDVNPGSPTYGSEIQIRDLYESEGLLLNFMASWCGPCRKELPDLEELHAQGDITVVLVSATERQGMDPLIDVVESFGCTMPVLYYEKGDRSEPVNRHYGRPAIPTTYLVDAEGVVRDVWVGTTSARAFRKSIERRLQ